MRAVLLIGPHGKIGLFFCAVHLGRPHGKIDFPVRAIARRPVPYFFRAVPLTNRMETKGDGVQKNQSSSSVICLSLFTYHVESCHVGNLNVQ